MTRQFRTIQAAQIAFGSHDRVSIDGLEYRPDSCTSVGWLMISTTSGIAKQIPHDELDYLNREGRIRCDRGYYLPETQRMRVSDQPFSVEDLPWTTRARLMKNSAYVEAWLALVEESRLLELAGKGQRLKSTDVGISGAMDAIAGRAAMVKGTCASQAGVDLPSSMDVSVRPSPRTLRKWIADFKRSGLEGLVDKMDQRGSRGRVLAPEVVDIMKRATDKYMSLERPTQEMVFSSMRWEISAANKQREAEGLPLLDTPSRETVRREISKIDPYQLCVTRYGKDVARKKFRPVTTGLLVTRALERVEIDEWTVDTVTLMESTGLREMFTPEELKQIGLDGSKKRWIITVAICCATKCIVGMSISPAAKASAAMQALEMVVSNKKDWADAVGALCPWDMFGLPEMVVTDCGSAFTSERFRLGCKEMGIRRMTTAAGFPELRGTIERLFGTMSRDFCARLSGRTFASIMEKGDADPTKRAALNVDDFCFSLVRWIVDIYHNRPHRGIDGLTPLEKWKQLTEQFGTPPSLDIGRRRAIFGAQQTRVLEKVGITMLGIRYHSDALAEHMLRSRQREMEVRWHPDDIGSIKVRLPDGWHDVPALSADMKGINAQAWLAGVRESRLNRGASNTVYFDTAALAAKAIQERDAEARMVAGIVVQNWSANRIKAEEERLMVGTTFRERKLPFAPDGRPGRSVLGKSSDVAAPSERKKSETGRFRTEAD